MHQLSVSSHYIKQPQCRNRILQHLMSMYVKDRLSYFAHEKSGCTLNDVSTTHRFLTFLPMHVNLSIGSWLLRMMLAGWPARQRPRMCAMWNCLLSKRSGARIVGRGRRWGVVCEGGVRLSPYQTDSIRWLQGSGMWRGCLLHVLWSLWKVLKGLSQRNACFLEVLCFRWMLQEDFQMGVQSLCMTLHNICPL